MYETSKQRGKHLELNRTEKRLIHCVRECKVQEQVGLSWESKIHDKRYESAITETRKPKLIKNKSALRRGVQILPQEQLATRNRSEANSCSPSQRSPRIYGTWKFIVVIKSKQHRSLSWDIWTHFALTQPISLLYILILFFRLHLDVHADIPTELLHTLLISPIRAVCLATLTLPLMIPKILCE